MFKRKEQEPDTPVFSVRAVDDYETLEYRHPAAFLSSAGLVNVRCDECGKAAYGPWVLSTVTSDSGVPVPIRVLVPKRILCESCSRKV